MGNRYEVYVSGRVQRVGFRWFVERTAKKLNIKGTVRNLSDKRVEIICETTDEVFKELLNKIKHGSFLSNVKDIQVNKTKTTNEFLDFKIIY